MSSSIGLSPNFSNAILPYIYLLLSYSLIATYMPHSVANYITTCVGEHATVNCLPFLGNSVTS